MMWDLPVSRILFMRMS